MKKNNKIKMNDDEMFEEPVVAYPPRTVVRELPSPPAPVQYEFAIDKHIGELPEYAELVNVLRSAQEGDIVVLSIDSPGGNLFTGQRIIREIQACEATVIADVCSQASSMASMIALSCDHLFNCNFFKAGYAYNLFFLLCHNNFSFIL